MPKIKNIIIFSTIGIIFILLYVFFVKKDPEVGALVSSSDSTPSSVTASSIDSSITQDFLALLLSVKSIRLDDSILSDAAFKNLRDSSITLTPDGNEGRPNPFAPLGSDEVLEPLVEDEIIDDEILGDESLEDAIDSLLLP